MKRKKGIWQGGEGTRRRIIVETRQSKDRLRKAWKEVGRENKHGKKWNRDGKH